MFLTLLIILLVSLLSYKYFYATENFQLHQDDPNCDCNKHKSLCSCVNCTNCGVCIKNNSLKCVQGDENGPYFATGCDKWINKSISRTFVNSNEDNMFIMRPYDYNYEGYTWNYFGEERPMRINPSPIDRATL